LKEQFLTLMEECQGIAHHICALYTHNQEDHNDLFQEILLQSWRSFKSFQHQSKFSTWLYRVALNTAITHLREKNKIKFTPLNEVENLASESFEYLDEEIKYLYLAIRKLSKIDRAIIMLYLDEYSYNEIAEIIGISSSNVGVRINRIKSKLDLILKSV
jgi:RNA polymerase sigma-70 factor (ECF subfamily)